MNFKDREPFRVQRSQEEREKDKGKIFTIRLNDDELKQLRVDMKLLRQVKPGTAFKQLVTIGSYVLHHDKIGELLQFILGNIKRNERIGIINPDDEIDANVTQK